MISIKSEKDIQKMREICKIVAKAHEEVKKYLKIGITTKEIDEIIKQAKKNEAKILTQSF